MENVTPQEVWVWLLGIMSGLLVIANVIEKISKAVNAAKAPSNRQEERIAKVEGRLDTVERKLDNDDARLRDIKKGDHAMQKALLALLDHGIDGNNIKQMQDAKDELNDYLIEK